MMCEKQAMHTGPLAYWLVFANGIMFGVPKLSGRLRLNSQLVIPKTQKMVLDAYLLNTRHL